MRKPANELFLPILLGAPVFAQALTCAPQELTLDEAYRAADAIVVALVSECEEEISTELWVSGGRDCSFSALETLKDSQPPRDYGGVASSSACGLSLLVGQQYLLFLDRDNLPTRFSVSLAADSPEATMAREHLRILRDFRRGVVRDLAEPWILDEAHGGCSIWHNVKGNVIRFSRPTSDAPPQPALDWIEERRDGNVTYRAAIPVYENDSTVPSGAGEIVAFDEIPDPDASVGLTVTLTERSSWPARRATLSVGDRTWPLHRLETSFSLPQVPTYHKEVAYVTAGHAAEQALAAMARSSTILVTATLVASAAAPPPENSLPALEASVAPHFGPTPGPRTDNTSPTPGSGSYEATREPPPEPVLRLVSRSTQIASVIESFEACGVRAR